jgi:hypothetical protein
MTRYISDLRSFTVTLMKIEVGCWQSYTWIVLPTRWRHKAAPETSGYIYQVTWRNIPEYDSWIPVYRKSPIWAIQTFPICARDTPRFGDIGNSPNCATQTLPDLRNIDTPRFAQYRHCPICAIWTLPDLHTIDNPRFAQYRHSRFAQYRHSPTCAI